MTKPLSRFETILKNKAFVFISFFVLINIPTPEAFGRHIYSCARLFVSEDEATNFAMILEDRQATWSVELYKKGHAQLASWEAGRKGDYELQNAIEAEIYKKLMLTEVKKKKKNPYSASTQSYIVEFHSSSLKAIFKPVSDKEIRPGLKAGYSDSYTQPINEVLAYKISRLLGLDIVPVTVIRNIDGQWGSLQIMVSDDKSLPKKSEIEKLKLLDYLIENSDRGYLEKHNFLTNQGNVVAIDHSLSFNASHLGMNEIPTPEDLRSLKTNAFLLNKIKNSLTEKAITNLLNPYFEKGIIDDVVQRRKHLINYLENKVF